MTDHMPHVAAAATAFTIAAVCTLNAVTAALLVTWWWSCTDRIDFMQWSVQCMHTHIQVWRGSVPTLEITAIQAEYAATVIIAIIVVLLTVADTFAWRAARCLAAARL